MIPEEKKLYLTERYLDRACFEGGRRAGRRIPPPPLNSEDINTMTT